MQKFFGSMLKLLITIAGLCFNRMALLFTSLLVLSSFNAMAENVTSDFAVVVNIKGVEPGKLKLTGETLANIYLGKITKWNAPEIAAYNSNVMLPDQSITVVHRSDPGPKNPAIDTTGKFTSYLSNVNANWRMQVGESTGGKKISWPIGQLGKGNDGVAACVERNTGTIGYVSFEYAHENKMTYVLLTNNKDQKSIDPYAEVNKREEVQRAAEAKRQAVEEKHQAEMRAAYESKYQSAINNKNPQQMYLAAVKYENDNERGRAKTVYLAIMDKFSSSPVALKAADRLANLKDVEAVESAGAANREAAYSVKRQNAEQCEKNRNACFAGCAVYKDYSTRSHCESGCALCAN